MIGRERVLKMLLDAGIVEKIKDSDVCLEIADLLGPIIEDNTRLQRESVASYEAHLSLRQRIMEVMSDEE